MMKGNTVYRATVMAEGTVKSFDDTVGRGLIARDGKTDVYVNRAAIKHAGPRTLAAGDRVQFQLIEGIKGPCAAAVHRL